MFRKSFMKILLMTAHCPKFLPSQHYNSTIVLQRRVSLRAVELALLHIRAPAHLQKNDRWRRTDGHSSPSVNIFGMHHEIPCPIPRRAPSVRVWHHFLLCYYLYSGRRRRSAARRCARARARRAARRARAGTGCPARSPRRPATGSRSTTPPPHLMLYMCRLILWLLLQKLANSLAVELFS